MNGFFKTIIAGWGAKKLGGGCFSTILIFIVIYYALGQCNKGASRPTSQQQAPVSQQAPASTQRTPVLKRQASGVQQQVEASTQKAPAIQKKALVLTSQS